MKQREASFWLFLRRMRTPLILLNLVHAIPIILLTIVPGIDNQGNTVHLSFFDAMYIVAYTATTIGFGEVPYPFTYEQRMVVFLTIYIAVPAWIYALGSLIALLQDKSFISALRLNAFRRKVRHLDQEFILICGYTDATRLLIDRINRDNHFRIVIIDINPAKIESLNGELYMPSIPAIAADASLTEVLNAAGIQSKDCKFIVTLFDDSQLNLKIAVRSRILNKQLKILARAGLKQGRGTLETIGVDHVIDVFNAVAQRIDFALRSPYLFNLLSWIQGGNLHVSKTDQLPKGIYIVCGRGRIAQAIMTMLEKNNIAYAYIDFTEELENRISANQDFFPETDIINASCIIAATNDDAFNLSIVAAARAVNPRIFTIVRENELEERSLFSHLRVDKIFALDQMAAMDAYNYIHRPMTFRFIESIEILGEEKYSEILKLITHKINKRPALIETRINETNMYALSRFLDEHPVKLGDLLNNPYNDGIDLQMIVLGIERTDGEFIILPDPDVLLKLNDRLLFTATHPSLKRFNTIVNHYYELYFVIHRQEASRFKWPW